VVYREYGADRRGSDRAASGLSEKTALIGGLTDCFRSRTGPRQSQFERSTYADARVRFHLRHRYSMASKARRDSNMVAPTQKLNRAPTDRTRRAVLAAGVLYLITFVTSIPALPLYHHILTNHRYVLGGASDTGVLIGAMLEIFLAIAGIGTAVVLFPILRRHAEARSLGFVTTRVLESAMILVGVLSVLSIVTLHQHGSAAGADPASLLATSRSLVAVHDWTFLLGPGLMPALNALCFASILYQTRLVPRIIPTIGLIGAPLLVASALASLFGAWDQVSSVSLLMTLPIAAWELSIGVWMTFKGFKASPDDSGVVDLNLHAEPAPATL